MTIDFQQLHGQIKNYGEHAQVREPWLQEQRQEARRLIDQLADSQTELAEKVRRTAGQFDPFLRCALPLGERLNASLPSPDALAHGTIIAADGSQINPDRHAPVNYSLINVGAILLLQGATAAPRTFVQSELLYDDPSTGPQPPMTEGLLALLRDLKEREIFLELTEVATERPVITFTDGPLELWMGRDPRQAAEYRNRLDQYLAVLEELHRRDVTTAGYVDKPGANLVTRLLEIAILPEDELPRVQAKAPLFGVTDLYLFSDVLEPGHRSAVYGLQSRSAGNYAEDLSVHFFYLNVGREGAPDLARVEIPAWVAADLSRVNALHAVLLQQCQVLGARSYPYLLHRAHEAALVSRVEREQVTRMLVLELQRRGLHTGRVSQKRAVKDLPGRGRF